MANESRVVEYTRDMISIDPEYEVKRITEFIKENVKKVFRKKGAVIGVSGGVDSALVLALCCKALGPEKVLALYLPEKESSSDNIDFINELIDKYDVTLVTEDLTKALEGFGCYQRRDNAIKNLYPDYTTDCKIKITLPSNILEKDSLNFFKLHIIDPEGEEHTMRLPHSEYMKIVASTNFKQRARMTMLYHHAELHNYSVIGTANKNEYEMGFFVKYGDSGVDIKPIAHLFKSQIYELAEYLEVPNSIRRRMPTSDTYSALQSQEEFFFRLPFDYLDRIWFGYDKGVEPKLIAKELELEEEQVQHVIDDIKRKINTTAYLRRPIPCL